MIVLISKIDSNTCIFLLEEFFKFSNPANTTPLDIHIFCPLWVHGLQCRHLFPLLLPALYTYLVRLTAHKRLTKESQYWSRYRFDYSPLSTVRFLRRNSITYISLDYIKTIKKKIIEICLMYKFKNIDSVEKYA